MFYFNWVFVLKWLWLVMGVEVFKKVVSNYCFVLVYFVNIVCIIMLDDDVVVGFDYDDDMMSFDIFCL